MSAERVYRQTTETGNVPGKEFARRFINLLHELRLQPGIYGRIERLLNDFSEEHPNVRASYISREVDPSYFSDGACGWEATARPKLQGLAIDNNILYEFLAFANGLQTHTTPLESIMNIEELWLEIAPDQPFAMRYCLYHSFPATTVLTASEGDTQEAAISFMRRLKYLRGF